MERLQRVLQARTMGGEGPNADHEQVDTAEQVYISSLALLKMLKHGEDIITWLFFTSRRICRSPDLQALTCITIIATLC